MQQITKQFKIMNGSQVSALLFTKPTPMADGRLPLYLYTATQLKNMQNIKNELAPYNAFNENTFDVYVKPEAFGIRVVKGIAGASNSRSVKNIEQYTGIVKKSFLDKNLPVISVIYIFRNEVTDQFMIAGKLISNLQGRRFMYAILQRLAPLVADNMSIGVVKNIAITGDKQYEIVCDFIISINALKLLERENFGFFIDTIAFEKFDYALAGLNGIKVTDRLEQEFMEWKTQHNRKVGKIVSQYAQKK